MIARFDNRAALASTVSFEFRHTPLVLAPNTSLAHLDGMAANLVGAARLLLHQGSHPCFHQIAGEQPPAEGDPGECGGAPAAAWTPLNPADRPAEDVARFGEQTDLKRAAQPEEISPAMCSSRRPPAQAMSPASCCPSAAALAQFEATPTCDSDARVDRQRRRREGRSCRCTACGRA